jgi:hypothetical protein
MTVVHKWVLLGSVSPHNEYPHRGMLHARWIASFSFGMSAAGYMDVFAMTGILTLFSRLNGSKIGRDVLLSSFIASPEGDLLTIGDGTFVGLSAGMYQHDFARGRMCFNRITIGKCARIVARLHLVPGTDLADGLEIGPNSMLLPGRYQSRCKAVQGNPARPCTLAALDENEDWLHRGSEVVSTLRSESVQDSCFAWIWKSKNHDYEALPDDEDLERGCDIGTYMMEDSIDNDLAERIGNLSRDDKDSLSTPLLGVV